MFQVSTSKRPWALTTYSTVILKHSTQEIAAVKHLRAKAEDLRGFNHLNLYLFTCFLSKVSQDIRRKLLYLKHSFFMGIRYR